MIALSAAIVIGANLQNTNLTNGNLTNTNLDGAGLDYALLISALLIGARYDQTSSWRTGFDPIAASAILVN